MHDILPENAYFCNKVSLVRLDFLDCKVNGVLQVTLVNRVRQVSVVQRARLV